VKQAENYYYYYSAN